MIHELILAHYSECLGVHIICFSLGFLMMLCNMDVLKKKKSYLFCTEYVRIQITVGALKVSIYFAHFCTVHIYFVNLVKYFCFLNRLRSGTATRGKVKK